MNEKVIKVGIIGTGHLGQYHLKHYKSINNLELIGFYDIDDNRRKFIEKEYNLLSFKSSKKLLSLCDAVSIVTPTKTHFKVAKKALQSNCHVLIEKPITVTVKEAESLITLAKEKNKIIQVGHIERFNPALESLKKYHLNPTYVEFQRLAPYTVRGTDVPVVLDLMIHDIDILLSLVKDTVVDIHATGLSILTESVDIAHALIKFKKGCVASITSSRISKEKVRKVKLYQKDSYTTVDLNAGLSEVYQVFNEDDITPKALITKRFIRNDKTKIITYDKPKVLNPDMLKLELENFIDSIRHDKVPLVSGEDGKEALSLAVKIQEIINKGIK